MRITYTWKLKHTTLLYNTLSGCYYIALPVRLLSQKLVCMESQLTLTGDYDYGGITQEFLSAVFI